MKRILSLFASLLAAGTVLSAQEYESIADVLEDYGKTESFVCEVAEGDAVAEYFLFHDYVPEFLDEVTLPLTRKLIHFYPSEKVYEDDGDWFAEAFNATIESCGYFLLHESELDYTFIRMEMEYVYEYILFEYLPEEDTIHIWALLGDYSLDMFSQEGGDIVELMYDFADKENFDMTLFDDRAIIDAFVREQFDLYDVRFGDNLFVYTMHYADTDEQHRFLSRLNDILDASYEQYGQTEDGGMYYSKSDEDSLYQMVFIYWTDNVLHINLVDGELPMEKFVVG